MSMRPWRATCVVVVMGALSIGAGAQSSPVGDLLGELGRYVGAAARFLTDAIAGVEKLEAAEIPANDRTKARDELTRISHRLSELSASQQGLLADLSAYSTRVRKEGFDPERDNPTWRLALGSVHRISGVVNTTLDVVEKNAWLKVALSDADRLTLREVLLGRVGLLQRLQQLPAPRTASELDALDGMSDHYRQLIKSLQGLNVALTGAAERIK